MSKVGKLNWHPFEIIGETAQSKEWEKYALQGADKVGINTAAVKALILLKKLPQDLRS